MYPLSAGGCVSRAGRAGGPCFGGAEDSRHHRTDGGHGRDGFFVERLHGNYVLPGAFRHHYAGA